MHYRTHRVDFLESEDELTGLMSRIERLETSDFNTADLEDRGGPTAIVPAAP